MKKTIILNWKCFPADLKEAKFLLNEICRKEFSEKFEVVVCPPFVYLEKIGRQGIKTGAQNCFWEKEGPFTGEISPLMLKNLGCCFVLLGHSERKRLFGESERIVNRKLRAALVFGLNVLLFFGEENRYLF